MVPDFAIRVLHESPLLTLRDVRCRPACAACGAEEFSDRTSVVFVRGGAFVRRVAGDDYYADSSRILFFNAGESYRVHHPVDGGDDCTSLVFSTVVLREAITEAGGGGGDSQPLRFPVAEMHLDGVALACLQRLRLGIKAKALDALEVEELSLGLLARIVRRMPSSRTARAVARSSTIRAHRSLVMNTRSYLSACFRSPLSLADVARAVHSTPFHLARVFARETAIPIHRHLLRLRLSAGLEALSEAADDLTGLALDLGFSSHSHFTASFRREFGIAPSQMRRPWSRAEIREMSKILKAAQHADE